PLRRPLGRRPGGAVAAFAVVALTTDERASTRGTVSTASGGDGLAVFTRMGCGGCHRLAAAGSTGPIGPDLDSRLPDHTRESLTAAILSHPPGAAMPNNFGERLSDADLDTLVDFLLSVREPR
ncbi:MAG: c-type cytochrome, partial [Thermoleophilaceae bacterium]